MREIICRQSADKNDNSCVTIFRAKIRHFYHPPRNGPLTLSREQQINVLVFESGCFHDLIWSYEKAHKSRN